MCTVNIRIVDQNGKWQSSQWRNFTISSTAYPLHHTYCLVLLFVVTSRHLLFTFCRDNHSEIRCTHRIVTSSRALRLAWVVWLGTGEPTAGLERYLHAQLLVSHCLHLTKSINHACNEYMATSEQAPDSAQPTKLNSSPTHIHHRPVPKEWPVGTLFSSLICDGLPHPAITSPYIL